jgi:hypothetical protein
VRRGAAIGARELEGAEDWLFEKSPPDPNDGLVSFENWISTGAEGPDMDPKPLPKFRVIGSTGSKLPISISESPPPDPESPKDDPEGLNENDLEAFALLLLPPPFERRLRPRASFGSEISTILPKSGPPLLKLMAGPGPRLRATDSISWIVIPPPCISSSFQSGLFRWL